MTSVPEILLVNDDPASLLALESLLNDAAPALGFDLVTARSGEEALRAVLLHDFAVILLDVNMPMMDGFETAEAIHAHPRSAMVPIIFVTAHHADEMYRLKGYSQGAVDYLLTPIIPQILMSKISVFVELRRKNIELQRKTEELAQLNQDLRVQSMQELKRINLQLEAEIIERKQAEDKAKELAIRDPLTGLLNRRSLIDHLEHARLLSQRQGRRFALLFLDLDKFKQINDTHGHEIGDKLLREVAMRLNGAIRESDIAARLGGDEFVVLLEALGSFGDIFNVANKVSRALGAEYRFDGIELQSSASIGVAIFPQDGTSIQALMKHADLAMYHAKQNRRGTIQFFHEGLNAEQMEHRQFLEEFDRALANRELVLHYQPRINVRTGKIGAIEAFVRWQHPRLGWIGAERILQAAPDRSLLLKLNEWMLGVACAQWRLWHDKGQIQCRVPLAVHPTILSLCPELAVQVCSAREQHGVAAGTLQVLVPDALLFPGFDNARSALGSVREAGAVLGISGFGTGYSSLTALHECSPGFLKVHGSLVRANASSADSALLSGILRLAQAMSLEVAADGVDSKEQFDVLHAIGFDEFQGALFCEPVNASLLPEKLLSASNSMAA
ncbi:MAG TPA: EAL domain-containing protein [Burkholderiaceae bacterium]